MAQHDFNIGNQGFAPTRADINAAITALASQSAGASAPSSPTNHQLWLDISASPLVLKMYDGADWILMGAFDTANNRFMPPQADTTYRGAVELATNAEALAGADMARAIVPGALKYALDNWVKPGPGIINGDFRIWRRGVSFTGNSEYTADRFEHNIAGGSTATVSRRNFTVGQSDVPGEPEFYYRFDKTVHVGGFPVMIRQKIENVRSFAGQTMTVSFWARIAAGSALCAVQAYQNFGAGGSATVTQSSNVTLTTVWQRFTKTFTLASIAGKTIGGDSHLYIAVTFADLGIIQADLALIKVETGAAATPFEARPLAAELALCQRYFVVLANASVNNRAFGFCAAASTTSAFGLIPTPVRMRTAPSINLGGAGVWCNGLFPTITTVSAIALSDNGVEATFGTAGSLSAQHAGILMNNTGEVQLDAEL